MITLAIIIAATVFGACLGFVFCALLVAGREN